MTSGRGDLSYGNGFQSKYPIHFEQLLYFQEQTNGFHLSQAQAQETRPRHSRLKSQDIHHLTERASLLFLDFFGSICVTTRHHLAYRVNTGKPGRLIARFHSYYEWNQAISLPGLPVFTQYPASLLLAWPGARTVRDSDSEWS